MSLNPNNMSFASSSTQSSSVSSGDRGAPMFPSEKGAFMSYAMVMRAHLAARSLWYGVIVDDVLSVSVSDSTSSSTSPKDEHEMPASSSASQVKEKKEKSLKAYAILLQSFRSRETVDDHQQHR